MTSKTRKRVEWEAMVPAIGPIIALAALLLPIIVHLDSKSDQRIDAIQKDMKDFHAALLEIQRGKHRGK